MNLQFQSEATAKAEKASSKAKQLQSPSRAQSQEFTVVLSPEEHQEYLRRRQLPGSPQAPTSPSSPWPFLAVGASPSQGGGQASLSGLLQQMAASAAAASTSQKRTSPTTGRPAILATPSMASTPTSFLEFVMILTPEEHADYLQRRQGDTGKSPSTSPGVSTVTASPLSTPQVGASPGSSRSSRTRSQQASLAGLLQQMSVSVPTT
eukprot:s1859_g3.t1